MKITDFEKELQEISPDFSISTGTNGLAEIKYQGASVCGIPAENIYDESNSSYGIEIGDRFMAHRGRNAALAIARGTLEKLKNKDESDAFFGRGAYSDKALSIEQGIDIPIDVTGTEVAIELEALPEPK